MRPWTSWPFLSKSSARYEPSLASGASDQTASLLYGVHSLTCVGGADTTLISCLAPFAARNRQDSPMRQTT